MNTISDGTTTVTPDQIDGWSSSNASRNIVHQIIGGGEDDLSLFPASPRRGQIKAVFSSEADAETCRVLHLAPRTFTFATTDRDLGIQYVVDGDVQVDLDDETRDLWVVTIPFREVTG